MLIEYKATGHSREVSEVIGRRLVSIGIAVSLDVPPVAIDAPGDHEEPVAEAAIVRPKRKYTRRKSEGKK